MASVPATLTACATAGSDPSKRAVCPPIVEYDREFQAQAADELALLPEPWALAGVISDYAVMREQSRQCASP